MRNKISERYRKQHGLEISPERILITPGASGGLLLLAHLLVGQGDGILITDLAYPCVRNFIKLRDASPQLVPVVRAQAYQPSVDDLIAQRTDITRGVWLASPNNPTGTILDRAQLEALSTWTRR